jgi:formate dehydrogenase maturation protein FdhE
MPADPEDPTVKPLGDRKRHFWMAQRMAKTTGANLVAAYDQGELDQQEWAQMVQNCRGCDWTEKCERWLQNNAQSEIVPESCPNCGRFAQLQSAEPSKGPERT